MSGVLGSILAIVQFGIAGRHQLLSNIFEIGMAGVLAFLAVSDNHLRKLGPISDDIAWIRQYRVLLLSICSVGFHCAHSTWMAYLPRSSRTGVKEHSCWWNVGGLR